MKNDLFNDRISRFSIRKLHVGVCSVLLGTLVMAGTATSVGADEVTENKQAEGVAAKTEVEKAKTPATTEVAPATEVKAAPAKEVTYQAEAAPVVSTEVKPELKTETLAAYVAEVEANLANGKYSNKTDESVEVLKASLANAQNALATATSQAELDAAYQSLVTTVNAKLKNKEVAKVEKPVVETPATTEATTGKPAENTKPAEGTNAIANTGKNDPRNGKEIDKNTAFRADTATATGIGADVEDATSTPKVEKPGFTTDIDPKSMTSQITWLDFGDVANWTGAKKVMVPKNDQHPDQDLEEKLALQVGATYTKEIMPGYVVTVKVKSMKPFQATEIYKKRMEQQGATEAEKATYDPNAKNGYVKGVTSTGAKKAFNDGMEADVVASAQNQWTEIKHENVDAKTKQTTMGSALNGGNIGVQFEISATFRGKKVKPAVVMADGESANPGEFVMFTTNGQGWQHIGEWKKTTRPSTSVPYEIQDTENLLGSKPKYNNINLRQLRDSTEVGPEKKPVAWKYFGNPDQVTGGLGTGIFGPNISEGNRTVPLVMTRGASEVGLYIASAGKQSAMLGFFPLDEGDAPESYGKAVHTIATVDGVTGAKVNQPYLGSVSPDMDENTTQDWFGDDKTTTADEGIDQLLPEELKGTTNEMIKMDRTRPGNYKMSVQAHLDGASEAHIYGWVDFNQNGTFDEDERSNLATITQDGTVELTFANSKTYIDPSVNELGARVRIAKKATEIESPTGMAFSGEVEDFKTQITHPPKGEFKETSGPQATKQTATVTFTARGEHKYQRDSQAVIDETVEPYIVDKDGNRATLDADGYYVVPGQGKYKITAKGKDVDVEFIPEDNFLGTADGISIRRSDNNGYDTGWSTKFPDQEPNINGQLNTMDGQYVPTVTPIDIEGVDKTSKDIQGATQKETPTFNTTETNANGDKISVTPSAEYPAKLVDPATGLTTDATSVTVAGEGTYTINPTTGEVTFTPEPSFTGTAKGVEVTLSAPVGRNKDGKIQEEYIKTATAKYTPTVVGVTPTATPAETKDIQGATQTGKPEFKGGTVEVNGVEKTVPINEDVPATFDDGSTTKTVEGVGKFTVAADGTVTFVPEPNFVGTAPAVTVVREDKNGTKASATYTPTVVGVTPTATPAETKDIQGATQTGKPEFKGGTVEVNGVEKTVPINEDVPATFDDGSTTKTVEGVGTYTVAADGTVTFVPEKSFVGTAPAVTVVREDKNGTKASATYTPTVTPVKPTAVDATSKDKQGQTQSGKPTFTPGNSNVPMDDTVPATFEDGSTTKVIPGEGTYTVAPDGTVTFVPEKSFTGVGTGVTVKRVDKNSTPATAKYTPTVTPVAPTATPAESEAPQGVVQTGTVTFTEGDPVAPIDKDTITLLDENGQPAASVDAKSPDGKVIGTFTVDKATGVVTFTPTDKSYSGEVVPVKVQAKDANATAVETTYTPKITPVVPTADPATSTDIQGKTQTGTPTFTPGNPDVPMDNDVPATFEDGSTTKVIPGEGTYTVAPDGTVTFVPEKSFTGTGTGVTVKRVDKNGTPVTAKYTPTVTPVTPTAEPVTSTDIQGKTQTGTPTFTPGNPDVPMDNDVPATFEDGSTTKVIPGEGTYTVAPDGTVTFVPEKSFTGVGTGVTVKRVDKNGTPVTAKYTPTVTPVAPTADPATSIGPKGQEQTGKPTFKEGDSRVPMNDKVPATFDDGSTTKTIPGVGTYTVAPDGTVTFKPEPEFTGTAPSVTVVREDMNGTKASATYTPTVTPVTTFVDKDGKPIPGNPTEDGEQPKKDIPGYRFVETKKLPNGDTVHVYEKVTTSYVDENGKPIPGYPTEDGEQPKKDIPGYEFVKTVVDKDGNVQHIYKKKVTPAPTPTPTPTPAPAPKPVPAPKPASVPVKPTTPAPVAHTVETKEDAPQLPNTGSEDHSSLAALGLVGVLSGFGLIARKKKED